LTPATDGLRNLGGRVNLDGTVTLYAVTSTVSASGDQGADPNKVVSITDTLSFTTAAQASGEQFTTLRTAGYGEILRGVAWSPKTFVPANQTPTITGVTPASGAQGTTVSMLLTGTNLSGATGVSFSGSGVTAAIQSSGATSLPSSFQLALTLTIAPNADPSARTITVTTPGGSASLSSAFTVGRVLTTNPLSNATVEQGTIQSGYAVITPDPGTTAPIPTVTYGTVSGGVAQSVSSISPAQFTTDALFYAEIIPAIGRNMGISLTNPTTVATQVTLTLHDPSGSSIALPVVASLQPQQATSNFISSLFPITSSGFRGSIWIHSPTPVAVLAIRFTGLEFSVSQTTAITPLQPLPVRTLAAVTGANTPLPGNTGGPTAFIVPQFAMGGGWATELSLVNSSTVTITGRIDIFDPNGNPLAMKLNGLNQSSFLYSISASGTFILTPTDANGQSPF
jgi:hypothetical protein